MSRNQGDDNKFQSYSQGTQNRGKRSGRGGNQRSQGRPQGQNDQQRQQRPYEEQRRQGQYEQDRPAPPPQSAWRTQDMSQPKRGQMESLQRDAPSSSKESIDSFQTLSGGSGDNGVETSNLTQKFKQAVNINDGSGDGTEGVDKKKEIRRYIEGDYLLKSRSSNLSTKHGKSGRPIALQSNYFSISEVYDKGLNSYHVTFTPELDTKYRKQIISRNKEKLGGYIFDGTKIYTKSSFDDFEFTTKSESTEELVKVSIKFVGVVHLSDAESLQLYNIIIRRCMGGLKLQLIGRNLFDPVNKIPIEGYNLEVWPGYITSFRQHEKSILLCCDIVHKVMRHETVLNILASIHNQAQNSRTDVKTRIQNELIGTVVLTDYNNKTYRIDDIDFEETPKSLFPTSNGNISYINYYKQRYNIIIKDLNQPMLITKPMEKNFRFKDQQNKLVKLIPELCRATGITDAMKNDRKLMSAMAEHTRVNPEQRVARLKAFQQNLYKTKESAAVLDEFNLKINSNIVDIPGRVIQEPSLVFGDNVVINGSDWDQCFKKNKLLQKKELVNWTCIVPGGHPSIMFEARKFVKLCQDAGRGMGFYVSEPEFIKLQTENNATYSRTLESACQRDPQIVMVFVNSNRADLYSCIKKKMICDRAIPSQVVRMGTIKRPKGVLSVATKVCVQMNAKLNCAPWSVSMPTNIMCIGFDVCHSTRDRNKSYGALVASMDVNKKPGVYFSAVSEHIRGSEISTDIAINVTKALRQYLSEHQILPSIIFFYRDGVGDGELQTIYHYEVNHIVKAIESVYKSVNAVFKLAYIVVSKRINTRIFTKAGGNKMFNPQPGTVVDDVITLPQRYDFFLISQSVRQGTVSPTSYNVLYDNTNLPPDRIQDMTHRQTHMYFNFFSPVRVPAPCQYAHKLAFMVGQYLHQPPNNILEKSLYYL